MDFQRVIMRLNEYWANQGCLLWQPHNVQVGAGTMNPATSLRVLGPEPWRVAYVEPSIRPDDGRYGDNPNRWQRFYQYQVILKPDPGNPQELYLESLRALGIDASAHDVRFVEDNWEAPALGAWGLGWEVWLDGQEITQYTYFQQAGGLDLGPVSVEITYGVERIVMVLQGVERFHDIRWREKVTYGDLHLQGEIEECTYSFEVADVGRLGQMYDLCEAEAKSALARGLVLPAHDYVLKCSHIFNVLDARGAVGVTERARYFVRMRDLARKVASLYVRQREQMGYPFQSEFPAPVACLGPTPSPNQPQGDGPHDLLLEIGSEELPVKDLDSGVAQLEEALSCALARARLGYRSLRTMGTPRRLVAHVRGLEARQEDAERELKGPPAQIAYDGEGNPTRAALGFARSQGVGVSALQTRQIGGRDYVVALVQEAGRESSAVLAEMLPEVVATMQFPLNMRWNASGVSYSRPLRWFVALLDDAVLPFEYAGIRSGRVSRGIRPKGSHEILIQSARDYCRAMEEAGIQLDVKERVASILAQARALAAEVGGELADEPDLLREVANLVEYPLAIRGTFGERYLSLPGEVLLAVMRVHQRYLPVMRDGHLLPYFIAVANGSGLDVDLVRRGNEGVLRARYADAAFFYDADTKVPLEEFTPRLAALTFQEQLGSVLDKVGRLERLVPQLCEMLGLSAADKEAATRSAALCKSDLATQLVVEFTSLQGKMGRHYAGLSGEPKEVALAIEEHYLPRFTGDRLPQSMAGVVVGLADRLDTLVGLFAVGVRPTGAADPWGLRRAALGVIQLWEGKELSPALHWALDDCVRRAAKVQPVAVSETAIGDVVSFVKERLRGYLIDVGGFPHDMVAAATLVNAPVNALAGATAIISAKYATTSATATLVAMDRWVERPDWQELLDTYARCVRITWGEREVHAIQEDLLTEPAERALYEAYRAAAPRVRAEATVDALFEAILDLKPFIRSFFDEVLVMTDDLALRNNRLGLLQAIGSLAQGIVNLREMEGF